MGPKKKVEDLATLVDATARWDSSIERVRYFARLTNTTAGEDTWVEIDANAFDRVTQGRLCDLIAAACRQVDATAVRVQGAIGELLKFRDHLDKIAAMAAVHNQNTQKDN